MYVINQPVCTYEYQLWGGSSLDVWLLTRCAVFEGCTSGAVVSAPYCHVEVLGSIPGQGEIYIENYISAARPAHSAVMNRPGLYLVEGKAERD